VSGPDPVRALVLSVLRDKRLEDVAKTAFVYAALSGKSVWVSTDLAVDLGWNVQRVGRAVRLLMEAGLAERQKVPVVGGHLMEYTFRRTR
jgi:predicted transcriptional regulator